MKPTATYSRKGLKRRPLSSHGRLSSSPSPEPVSVSDSKRRKITTPELDSHAATKTSSTKKLQDHSKHTSSTSSVKSLEAKKDINIVDGMFYLTI
jgi:hypothetical protein